MKKVREGNDIEVELCYTKQRDRIIFVFLACEASDEESAAIFCE